MAILVKNLLNGRRVIFDTGKFDDWCVFIVESDNNTKRAPFDVDYFSDLALLSKHYPGNKIYNDFVSIYEMTKRAIDPTVLQLIDNIVPTYQPRHHVLMELWFTVLYAGMISEENKTNAILKKRVKRLGIHQVLIQNSTPSEAAKFSYGKPWRELDKIMQSLGF